MQDAVSARIEAIRQRVRDERGLIAELSRRLGDLKRLLHPALQLLTDVELLFLGAHFIQEKRNAAEWDYWLDEAEKVFQSAVERREFVQRTAEKFGPNAKVI